jgi:hypothetical protein
VPFKTCVDTGIFLEIFDRAVSQKLSNEFVLVFVFTIVFLPDAFKPET